MTLRPELPPLPARIAALPVHRGYPVPWFVQWMRDGQGTDPGDGEPEFRIMDSRKLARAVLEHRCWVCGDRLGARRAYTVGPMCAVNRTSAEPPSHRECAIFSAVACPFLSRPHMRRREAGRPEEAVKPAGDMIERNPGVALVWITRGTRTKRDPDGGILFDIGDPLEVLWYAEGRPATRAEVLASIESGLPLLAEVAAEEGAEKVLARMAERALALVPA